MSDENDWVFPEQLGMKTNYIIHLDQMSIAIADLCDYHGKGLMITRINVPPKYRGMGYGRVLLSQIIADANRTNTTLFLEIHSSGKMTYDQLSAWYRRYGFEGIGFYRRLPGVSK